MRERVEDMEEQFVLRVPPSVAERIERLLNDPSSSEDKNLDLVFSGIRPERFSLFMFAYSVFFQQLMLFYLLFPYCRGWEDWFICYRQ